MLDRISFEIVAILLAAFGILILVACWRDAFRKMWAAQGLFNFAGQSDLWGGAFGALVVWAIALTLWMHA